MELLARTCNYDVMNVQRILARGFLIVGALFWGSAAYGAKWAYQGAPFTEALAYGLLYAGAILAVLVIGMFYENLAAVILAVGSVAIILIGVFSGWEAGVWGVMTFFFILPLVVAAVLFALAAGVQRRCDEQL